MRSGSIGAILAFACLGLTACASTGPSRTDAARVSDSDTIDYQKVASVNQWAHTHGALVMWIHYPQKPQRFGTEDGT
jgi:outer membrane biogenesis lipoprotein LolB